MTVIDDTLPGPIVWPSIDEIPPQEEGGPIARAGFSYQDEVAVGFLIEMLRSSAIVKVHCESHDDILIVRCIDGILYAEFVQVKGNQLDQLWSVANLCTRKKGLGTSIFEVSLARDRHDLPSLFRLVTHRPVAPPLRVLTYPLGSLGRESDGSAVVALQAAISEYHPDAKSPKGNDTQFWIENCVWDIRNDQSNIANANLIKLIELSALDSRCLLPEQAQVLLTELREWAKRAGEARWTPDRDKKVIARDEVCAWWERRTAEIRDGAVAPGGGKLSHKLDEIGAGSEMIALAVELRRDYAALMRTPRYMEADETAELQQRVKSEMMRLRARYSAGHLDIDGVEFLSLCLDRLDEVNEARPDGEQDRSAFLQGCMYDITDRCLHRFGRPLR